MNTNEFLEISSTIVPKRTAVTFDNRHISFQELREMADKLANILVNFGIKHGDTVAMLDVNSPQVLVAYFACAKLDAIFVPLNYRAKEDELRHMLALSNASILFTGHRYISLVKNATQATESNLKVVVIGGPGRDGWFSYEGLMKDCEEKHTFIPTSQDKDTTILLFTSMIPSFLEIMPGFTPMEKTGFWKIYRAEQAHG